MILVILLMFSSILKLRSTSALQYLLDPMVDPSIAFEFYDKGRPRLFKPSPDGDFISVASSPAAPEFIMIRNNKTGECHYLPQSGYQQEVHVDGNDGFSCHHHGGAATSIWSQRSFNYLVGTIAGVEEVQVYNKSKNSCRPFCEFLETQKVGIAFTWKTLFTTPVKFQSATNRWLPHGGMYTVWSVTTLHTQSVLSTMRVDPYRWARKTRQQLVSHLEKHVGCTNPQWLVRRGSPSASEDIYATERKCGNVDVRSPTAEIGVWVAAPIFI